MVAQRLICEHERCAGLEQAHAKVVVLATSATEDRIEATYLCEERRPYRDVSAEQVLKTEAVAGFAHRVEVRLPPGPQECRVSPRVLVKDGSRIPNDHKFG